MTLEGGSAEPWKLDSLGVTLSTRGAELAGRCLLHLLSRFEGRQLATFGSTGIPLLQSCVLLSKGKYRGIIVRKEREVGPGKHIEGRIDPSEPVVIISDSVGLESSMEECTAQLEAAGLRVEGGVCLVRFGYETGFSRMVSRGYRMHSLFDIWNDLVSHMPGEEALAPNPTRAFVPHELTAKAAPEGLHPAELARRVIDEALRTGKLAASAEAHQRPVLGRGRQSGSACGRSRTRTCGMAEAASGASPRRKPPRCRWRSPRPPSRSPSRSRNRAPIRSRPWSRAPSP